MSTVTLEDAKEVTRKLVGKLPLKAVIVFGSVAREGKGNDLDLLIIREEDDKPKFEAWKEVGKLLEEYYERGFSFDYFVAVPSVIREEFYAGGPFLRLIQREGKSLYMKDSMKEWMEYAKTDLAMAEYLLKGGFYRGAGVHARQALEKALKGLLISKGWELQKIHNIRELISFAEIHKIPVDIPDQDITLIDSVYRGRYPGEQGLLPTGEPTEAQAKQILSAVKAFFKSHIL